MSDAERIEAAAATWLARRDRDDWSEADERALQAWLDESTAHRVACLRLESTLPVRADRLGALRGATPVAAVGPLQRLARFSILRIAAAFLFAVAAGGAWFGWQAREQATGYTTAVGGRESVRLPDGSTLTLNTDTRVRTAIDRDSRTVWLDRGEAFFEVAHDAQHPFVVFAGKSRVTVLGTKFSVRRLGDHVDVVVAEGRVRIQPVDAAGDEGREVVAVRNDKVIAGASQSLVLKKTDVQISNELGWRQGRLVLDQMTLSDAAAEFNRYNRQKLIVVGADAGQLRLGGSFDTGNLKGFVQLLRQGFGLSVQEEGGDIRISD